MSHRAERVAPALAALLAVGAPTGVAAAAAQYETVVRARGGPPQPVSTSVDAEQARRLPGAAGDPSSAAKDLPGVSRPAPGATGLVMWGAAPAESRVLFEGIEIPALYQWFNVVPSSAPALWQF